MGIVMVELRFCDEGNFVKETIYPFFISGANVMVIALE